MEFRNPQALSDALASAFGFLISIDPIGLMSTVDPIGLMSNYYIECYYTCLYLKQILLGRFL